MMPIALAPFLLCAALPGEGIAWQSKLEDALALAREQKKVVFLAVNMDGERANERMVEKVYRDKAVVALSASTLNLVASAAEHASLEKPCPRFAGLRCLDHRRIDTAARDAVLKADSQGFVIAPQHVFLAPDGKPLLSVPYEISAGELAWCFVTALRAADPASRAELPPGARPPRRLVMGGVYDPKGGAAGADRPPTRSEVLELIKKVKKGLPGEERFEAVRRILLADEPEAIEFIRAELRSGRGARGGGGRGGGGGGGPGGGGPGGGGLGGGGGGPGGDGEGQDPRARLLHAIGVLSPSSYWEVVADFAVNGEKPLRHEAAVALEQLASPDSLRAVQTALGREQDDAVLKDWLRALGSAGAGDAHVRTLLLKRSRVEKDEVLRLNALVALGSLAPSEDVQAALSGALKQGSPTERAAAACAMAITRDPRWLPEIESARAGTQDESLVRACEASAEALKNGDLRAIREPVRKVAKDEIQRERFFGAAGR